MTRAGWATLDLDELIPSLMREPGNAERKPANSEERHASPGGDPGPMDPFFRFVEAPSRAGMVRSSYQLPIQRRLPLLLHPFRTGQAGRVRRGVVRAEGGPGNQLPRESALAGLTGAREDLDEPPGLFQPSSEEVKKGSAETRLNRSWRHCACS